MFSFLYTRGADIVEKVAKNVMNLTNILEHERSKEDAEESRFLDETIPDTQSHYDDEAEVDPALNIDLNEISAIENSVQFRQTLEDSGLEISRQNISKPNTQQNLSQFMQIIKAQQDKHPETGLPMKPDSGDYSKCMICQKFVPMTEPSVVCNHMVLHWPDALVRQCPSCSFTDQLLSEVLKHAVTEHPLIPEQKAKKYSIKMLMNWKFLLNHAFPGREDVSQKIAAMYEKKFKKNQEIFKVRIQVETEGKIACQKTGCSTVLAKAVPSALLQHAAGHCSKRQFACSVCGFSTVFTHSLRKHLTSYHDGEATQIDKRSAEMEKEWDEKVRECFPAHYDRCLPLIRGENKRKRKIIIAGDEDEKMEKKIQVRMKVRSEVRGGIKIRSNTEEEDINQSSVSQISQVSGVM